MVIKSSNVSPPVEGILSQTPATKLLLNDEDLGTGTLYITENNVVWSGGVKPSGVAAPAVSVLYPYISVHGIQREPFPALHVVLNYDLRVTEEGQAEPGNENDEDDDPITQLRFIPENENDLEEMFSAMKHGLSLHPEPTSEADIEDEAYMDEEEIDYGEERFEDAEEVLEETAARLHQMNIEITNGSHQFDDSDDADITEE